MPRSNSPSCSHEQTDCNCKNKSASKSDSNSGSEDTLFKRRVISDQVKGEWHTSAMSMVLLLMHTVLILKLAGISLSSCAISLGTWGAPSPPVSTPGDEVLAEQNIQSMYIAPPVRLPDYGGSGTLAAVSEKGEVLSPCPLQHTSVVANVSGGVARVEVTQKFKNPYKSNIEAVYTFPLDEHCAVESMRLKSGTRMILGDIKPRAEAETLYKSAAAAGKTAALLEEERPNIFTQSVANVHPGEDVSVTLNYVTALTFADGNYTFTFPTVVGPRFIPGNEIGARGAGTSSDTDIVPDASRLSPPAGFMQSRSGHDISMEIRLDSPFPISDIQSKLHSIKTARGTENHSVVSLSQASVIPNKDFVLSWHTAGNAIQTGIQTHRIGKDGYLSVSLMPPDRVSIKQPNPKELIFLVDCSGSQDGFPIEKAKETLSFIVDRMGPADKLQVLAFNTVVEKLFDHPKSLTPLDKLNAKSFIQKLSAKGGTFMAEAVEEACAIPIDRKRLRIVTFMTDGYVGNDNEVLGLVRKYRGKSRWFSFGTGDSVNRYLIDGIAREGGGEADYVLLNGKTQEIAESFWNRISSPVLTDVKIDFGNLPVQDVVPNVVSDVWAHRPLTFSARYSKPAHGVITISGYSGGKKYKKELAVDLPATDKRNSVIGTLWARQKIEQLSDEDNLESVNGYPSKHTYEITKLGLEHHLLTPYTSFVAIDHYVKPQPVAKMVRVPVRVAETDALHRYVSSQGGLVGAPVDPRYRQSNEVGHINETYMGIKRFYANDIIENLFQNIGQLIGKWISEWINGFFADLSRWLMRTVEMLIFNPYLVMRGICNPPDHAQSHLSYFAIRSAIDLMYGIAGGFLLLLSIAKSRSVAVGQSDKTVEIFRCGLAALLLLAGPWLYRMTFQLSDVFITQAGTIDYTDYLRLGDAVASAMKGGLMAGAGLLAYAFSPVVSGAAGGLALGLIGEIVALVGLVLYLGIGVIVVLQLCYLLFLVASQSLLFALHTMLGPIALACSATHKTEKVATGYITIWIELGLWLVTWVGLTTAMKLLLFSDLNPWFKIVMAICVLQAMIFTPPALSVLKISPMSKFLAMNPVGGLAAGVSQLVKTALEIHKEFKTPR
jgi:Ca-activated chloride channel homolog